MLLLIGCTSNTNTDLSNEENGKEQNEEQGPKQGGDLVVGTTAGPTVLNPYFSTDIPTREIFRLMLNGLVTIDREFNPVGSLAESWEISDDGTEFIFHLRNDVKWHDGVPFTADDVVFTYSIPMHEDYSGPRGTTFQVVESVEKLDDYKVKITLTEPYAPFINITAVFEILPKHLLEDIPVAEMAQYNEYNKSPVGTGPFKFGEWREGQYVQVVANDEFFEGRPNIDSITFKIVPDSNALMAQLQTGDVNFAGVPAEHAQIGESLYSQGKINLISGPRNAWEYIGYNLRNPLFEDKKVRQALTHAIDKEAIVEAVLNGQGVVAHGPGSPANWAFTEEVPVFEYNPEKAKQLLESAGWKEGNNGILEKNGEKFTFTLTTTSANDERQRVATIVQQMWKEVGVDVNIELLEWSAYLDRTGPPNWKFDAVVAGWTIGSDPDPSYFWHTNQIESGLNYYAYSNPEVDALLDKNTQILDQKERKSIIEQLEKIVTEEQPYTNLYYPNGFTATAPNLIGPEYSPANSWFKVHEWYFD